MTVFFSLLVIIQFLSANILPVNLYTLIRFHFTVLFYYLQPIRYTFESTTNDFYSFFCIIYFKQRNSFSLLCMSVHWSKRFVIFDVSILSEAPP